MPYLDELTPEQQANFEQTTEVPVETYEGVMFSANRDKQIEDLKKFGFDTSRLGIR